MKSRVYKQNSSEQFILKCETQKKYLWTGGKTVSTRKKSKTSPELSCHDSQCRPHTSPIFHGGFTATQPPPCSTLALDAVTTNGAKRTPESCFTGDSQLYAPLTVQFLSLLSHAIAVATVTPAASLSSGLQSRASLHAQSPQHLCYKPWQTRVVAHLHNYPMITSSSTQHRPYSVTSITVINTGQGSYWSRLSSCYHGIMFQQVSAALKPIGRCTKSTTVWTKAAKQPEWSDHEVIKIWGEKVGYLMTLLAGKNEYGSLSIAKGNG